ncbi:MAG: DUF523 domain-containing protein [Deltaproteobacteria bacterium]|nr:MAG: DUF523 domain-containing protein [Deltaproteobacteria bacterium]
MIVVSACLVGINCRYDSSSKTKPELLDLLEKKRAVPVCPEQLGGLPTPRTPAKIQSGDGYDVLKSGARVIDIKGRDVTRQFIKGAIEAFNIAMLVGADKAILKDKSPSCGVNYIWDDDGLKEGKGVLTALLIDNGIKVSSGDL